MSIREAAKQCVTLSEIMANRNKISTDDVIKKYPDGITITGVDYVTLEDNVTYPVFTFEEDITSFYAGGTLLNNMFDRLIDKYGSIGLVNHVLDKEGGLKVRLSNGVTKKTGRPITKVEVL